MGTTICRRVAILQTCAMLVYASSLGSARQTPTPFRLQEATIAQIHAAFAAGAMTCAQLTQLYLNRIDAYNVRGPALRAIITVNPNAIQTAMEMDRRYKASPSSAGPLHCIPTILKDNVDPVDMPTTGGSIAMRSSQPRSDAQQKHWATHCRAGLQSRPTGRQPATRPGKPAALLSGAAARDSL